MTMARDEILKTPGNRCYSWWRDMFDPEPAESEGQRLDAGSAFPDAA